MLLALDTATRMMGIALYDGTEVWAEVIWQTNGHHTVELGPEVVLLLRRQGLGVEDLGAVAVAEGPGSYTGLRIGMALAKGLAVAQGIPLVGVPTLDILAYGQPPSDAQLVGLIHAGRSRVAAVWYKWESKGWKPKGEPETYSWDELVEALQAPAYVVGELGIEGREKLKSIPGIQLGTPAYSLRRPGYLAELGWKEWKRGRVHDPGNLTPLYLKSPEGEHDQQ